MSERNSTDTADRNQQDSKEIPDWLPDWRNPNEYPDPNETSIHQWAWEFLRRNPGYQQVCQEHRLTAERSKLDDPDCVDWGINYFLHPSVPPKDLPDGLFRKVPYFHEYDPCEDVSRRDYEKSQQDLQDSIGRESERRELSRFQTAPRDLPEPLIPRKPAELVVRLAADLPIRPQLEQVKAMLDAIRREHQIKEERIYRRSDETDYVRYLRILDAKALKVSSSKIAQAFYPDEKDRYPQHRVRKRIDRQFDSAKRLRDRTCYLLTVQGE